MLLGIIITLFGLSMLISAILFWYESKNSIEIDSKEKFLHDD